MNYVSVFKEALNTFWHHKSLWIFGIVITIFGQGEYSFSINYRESYPAAPGASPSFPSIPGRDLLLRFLDNPVPYIIGFSLLGLLFWIISSLICWWSQSALISMVDDVDQRGSTSLKNSWIAGKHRAIPLTVIAFLFALPTVILMLPVIAGGIWMFYQLSDFYRAMLVGQIPSPEEMQSIFEPFVSNIFLGFACFFPLICVSGIFGWLLNMLNKITARSFVLEHLSILNSIKRGWQITRENLGHILLNGIVLIVISVAFGWMAAIPALIIWVPVARAFLHQTWSTSTIIAAVFIGFYFLIVGIGLGGILTSFNSTLWTKLYKAMVAKENVIISNSQTG